MTNYDHFFRLMLANRYCEAFNAACDLPTADERMAACYMLIAQQKAAK